jgi:hypothetical protein
MRFELASGAWVEVRDTLKGSDKTAVLSTLKIQVKDGAAQEVGADISDRMHNALLNLIITSWSYPEPVPAAPGGRGVEDLDLDDYNELHAKTADIMKRVNFKVPN